MMKRGLAYVFSRFPLLSETFLLREVLELERQGWSLELCSIQRERATLRHPEAERLLPRVRYLDPFGPRTLRASARLLKRSPRLYARLLATTVARVSATEYRDLGKSNFRAPRKSIKRLDP